MQHENLKQIEKQARIKSSINIDLKILNMAYRIMCLQALLGFLLLIFVPLLADVVHASVAWRMAAKFAEGDGHEIHVVAHSHHRPTFTAGAWKHAHATFYEGGSGTFGMNSCFFFVN